MAKRIYSLVLVLLVLCALPLTAHAHDVPQMRSDCSIELLVQYQNTPINSGEITAILVGYPDADDGNYFFRQVFTGERLEDDYIQNSDTPKQMLDFYNASKDECDFIRKNAPIRKGVCRFDTMSTGLYLIIQEKASTGYSKLSPFLVSVPYMQDGKYQYDVTAKLKTELQKRPEPSVPPKSPNEESPNSPNGRLPQTGQLNWPVPVLISCGLVLFVCGWLIRFKGKRKTDA